MFDFGVQGDQVNVDDNLGSLPGLPESLPDLPFPDERLSEEDEATLKSMVRKYLDMARGDGSKPTERAKLWRKYMALEPYDDVPYEGAPNITTPLIRQKADGIRAHVQGALDQQPLFIVKPRTERATSIAPQLEAILSSIIETTGSRDEMMRAVRDAVEVGTGHVKHVAIEDSSGNIIPISRYVPFEYIWVWPTTRVRPELVNYFELYKETYQALRDKANLGVYWSDRVQEVLGDISEDRIHDEVEVWECWVRFRDDFYEIRYHLDKDVILSYRKSAWAAVLGRAPYDPIYIEPSQTSYWGDSIAQVLEGLQRIADAAFNMEIARGQYSMNPPILISATSPAFSYLQREGMWKPGEIIPGSADPRLDIFIPMQGLNPFDVQLLQLANQLAEGATIPDVLVPGRALGGRKTATEVNVVASTGGQKLRNYLNAAATSLKRHATAKWTLVAYTVLKSEELANTTEFEWVVNGRETIPEQQSRLQALQTIANPAFLQLVQASAQDEFLARVLEMMFNYMDLPGLGAEFRRINEERRKAAAVAQMSGVGVGAAQGQAPGNRQPGGQVPG